MTPKDVISDLSVLSRALSCIELRLVGGEPLLHPNIVDVVLAARSVRIAKRLTLVTNGTLLNSLDPEVWHHIDGMWVSIYPEVQYTVDWHQLRELAAANRVWLWMKRCDAFDDSLLTTQNTNGALVQWIYERCITHPPRFSYFTVRKGRLYMCQRGAYMEDRLRCLDIDYQCESADGVDIHCGDDLSARIAHYIGREQPLRACTYCLGSAGRSVPCAQETPKGANARLHKESIRTAMADGLALSPFVGRE